MLGTVTKKRKVNESLDLTVLFKHSPSLKVLLLGIELYLDKSHNVSSKLEVIK